MIAAMHTAIRIVGGSFLARLTKKERDGERAWSVGGACVDSERGGPSVLKAVGMLECAPIQ
eukprot:705584-Rhodomonas_salina.1